MLRLSMGSWRSRIVFARRRAEEFWEFVEHHDGRQWHERGMEHSWRIARGAPWADVQIFGSSCEEEHHRAAFCALLGYALISDKLNSVCIVWYITSFSAIVAIDRYKPVSCVLQPFMARYRFVMG